jgi:hypothetical protein
MRGFGVFSAVALLVLTFAAGGVCAQTATTASVGKPLALLAGLRPPHETKHHATKHVVHAKATHAKTAARTYHGRLAAHAKHASATTIATRHHAHHEQGVAASAFAEEPPPQAATPSAPAPDWPAASPASIDNPAASDPAPVPAADNAPPHAVAADVEAQPGAAQVQTIKITAPNPASLPDPAIAPVASAAEPAADSIAAAPAAATQTVMAAPVQETANNEPLRKTTDAVGSASWIAQVLAALGGAIAAGAVAWFLIGAGPVRTYG